MKKSTIENEKKMDKIIDKKEDNSFDIITELRRKSDSLEPSFE